MKELYLQFLRRSMLAFCVVGLLKNAPGYGQTVPNVQWSKSGSNLVALPDGNLAASVDNRPVGEVMAKGVVKYTLAGDPIWTRIPTGFSFVGRIGLGYAPLQSINQMEATVSGGLIIYGVEYGTGQRTVVVLDANGAKVNAFPFPSSTGISLTVNEMAGTPDGGFLIVGTSFVTGDGTHKDTFVYKYDSQGNASWSTRIEYPNANPAATDYSITSAEAVINASDGGYLLVGYYSPNGPPNTFPATDFDPVSNSTNTRAWVAKLEGNGNLAWQKLLVNLPIEFKADSPAPGSIASLLTLTDVMPAAAGNGYALVGAGIMLSSHVIPPAQTALIELSWDGTYKRGRLMEATPTPARLKLYTSGGMTYYAIGHSDGPLPNGTDPEILLVQPAQLNTIVTRRVFDSPSNTSLHALVLASDGSLGFSTGQEVYKLQSDVPSGTPLAVDTPTYDCTTGQLMVQVTGATGAPLEYQIVGLRSWGASSVFEVPAWQRTGTTFNIEVRQGNQVASRWFTTSCALPPPSGLTMLAPLYDCNTGQLTVQIGGGDNSVQFRVVGLRDWDASPVFSIPPWQRVGTPFTLEARLSNGQTANWTFTSSCDTPPPASNLSFVAPTLQCNGSGGSAQLMINLAGIPFDPNGGIEYKVPGLADWQTSNTFTVPNYQANGTIFTLYVRRMNNPMEFTTQFTTTCQVATRKGVGEMSSGLEAVLYPNPVGEQFTVEVRGAAQQAVRFDLTDAQGRALHNRQVAVQESHHWETFRLSQTPAGFYYLRVATPQQALTLKVLKL